MRDFLQCIKYIRLALIVISSFILPIHSYAQGVYFKQLSVHNGLSQNDVSSIVQDSYGFIWIGTYDGLNRFDGIKVESFRKMTANLESLPDNRITALEEDDKKRLWIGTQAGLLSYYSLKKQQFIRVESPENTGVINDFLQANDNTMYAITSTGILRLKEVPEPIF